MIQPGCCTGPRCSCPLWPLSHARRRLLLLFSLLSWFFCSSAAGVFCFLPLFPFILQEFCSAWGKGWGWRGLRARRKSRERRRWGCCQAYSDPLVPPWSPPAPTHAPNHTRARLWLSSLVGELGGVRRRLHNPSRVRGNPLPGKAAGKACEERERGWEESARLWSWGCSQRFVHRGQRGAELLLSRGGCRERGQGAAEGPER